MLHIDIDPRALRQGQEVARHHLRADARLGVEALTAALPARSTMWRTEAMAARIRDSKPDSYVFEIEPGLLDPRDVVEGLEKTLPRGLGGRELLGPLLLVLRADALAPAGAVLLASASSARSATASPSPWAWRQPARIDRWCCSTATAA